MELSTQILGLETRCFGSRPTMAVARTTQLRRRSRRGSNVVPSLHLPALRRTAEYPNSAILHTLPPHIPWSKAQEGFEHSPITSTVF